MYLRFLSVFSFALLASGTAGAATIFSSDFSDEGATTSTLNYTGFDDFSVSSGSVDLIRSGDYGISCETGGWCLDLDGSTRHGGTLTSSVLRFLSGFYRVEATISGNQRTQDEDVVDIGVTGGLLDETITVGGDEASTDYSFDFSVDTDTSASLFIRNLGGDNIGAILDKVSVENIPAPVPVPASLPLLAGGLGLLVVARRRKILP